MFEAEVIKNYLSEFLNPLRLSKGAKVFISEKKTGYKGWLWGTDENGNSGWIPENFVDRTESEGRLLVDYDATELTVGTGDILTVRSTESDWAWCQTIDGKKGWVPLENVRRL